jgi:transcriptional regulator with XRE-family HTH domain
MVERIKLILQVNNITASRFADEIGVQRSSISHILSGRNMPSLDLIQKILKRFPEINSEWLLNGNGSMIRNQQPDLFSIEETAQPEAQILKESDTEFEGKWPQLIMDETKEQIITDVMPTPEPPQNAINEKLPDPIAEFPKQIDLTEHKSAAIISKRIEKIVILYNDKTFSEYFPE